MICWVILATRYIKYVKIKTLILVLKTYKEVKPHSSEKIEDKVVERERYNDDND